MKQMTLDIRYYLLGTGIAAFSALILLSSGGNLLLGLLPLAIWVLFSCSPMLLKIKIPHLIAGFVFIFLVFDSPAGRPYYDYSPITENLGFYLFENLNNLVDFRSLSFSIFELLSVVFFLLVVFSKRFRQDPEVFRSNREVYIFFFMTLLLPALALIGLAKGIGSDGDLTLAIRQIRPFPFYSLWFFVGYCAFQDLLPLFNLLKVLFVAVFLKALLGIYVYFIVLNGTLGQKEFLIDHITSDFLATALVFAFSSVMLLKDKWHFKIMTILVTLPILLAYFLNDRRASLMGLLLSVALLPLAFRFQTIRPHLKKIAVALLAFFGFILLTWGNSGILGFVSRSIRSVLFGGDNGSIDYRTLENFNLLKAVADYPWTGLGFGRRFHLFASLPDISFVYEDFDLIPHNTVLFLWAFLGPLGMAALGTIVALCLAVAIRMLRQKEIKPQELICALVGFSAVIRWLVYVSTDMGLFDIRLMTLFAIIFGALLRQGIVLKKTFKMRNL